jgi:hypothetical protein
MDVRFDKIFDASLITSNGDGREPRDAPLRYRRLTFWLDSHSRNSSPSR